MEKKKLRIVIVTLLIVVVVLLSLTLTKKDLVNDFIRNTLQIGAKTSIVELKIGCPQSLAIYHFVDPKQTKTLEDDDVFIAILNKENNSYSAEIFVNKIFQEKTVIIKNNITTIKSKLMTNWWRKGIKGSTRQGEEKEDSVEENGQDHMTFIVDIIIQGCNKTITTLTPPQPNIEPTSEAASGGGGTTIPGWASRYSIDISKKQITYLPD